MTNSELFEKFIQAIYSRDLEMVKYCVKKGVDVNRAYDSNGDTPLYLCLKRSKDADIFNYLVKHGADVTKRVGEAQKKDWQRNSLLYFALSFQDVPEEIVKTILMNGGYKDINYAPKGELTPGERAYLNKDEELLKIFSKFSDIRISPELVKANKR